MNQAISNRKLYPAIAAGILVSLAGGAVLKVLHSPSEVQSETENSAMVQPDSTEEESTALEPLTPFEQGPFVQASPSFRLANPALLQSTSSNERTNAVVAGRSDPFAPVVRPAAVPRQPRPDQAEPAVVPAQVSPVQTLPVVPVTSTQTLPPLPSLPAPAIASGQPQLGQAVAVAPTPAPVMQSPIDQIAVTGVAQIGDTVSVIVRESGSASSRHVKQGDLLAGGQVRVKSINTSTAEPVVVLSYNGQDFTRTVGSGALIGSL
jgi:hypothetical protein